MQIRAYAQQHGCRRVVVAGGGLLGLEAAYSLHLLGFTTRRGLCKATYARVFRRIGVADFEAHVGRWIGARLGGDEAPHLCVEGKTARGGSVGGTPGVHMASAY